MTDFETWEKAYLSMDLLRFTTAGSVDDGKSTLIGRLLYDSKSIFEDQLEAIELTSKRSGEEGINLALITDGLKAEREQGITIDVAYRYFALPKRKFIIADTPGHIQYTRNMVTGASTANLSILLIDARHGISEQTLRHSYISSLLRINHVILCINKMDLVNFSQEVFDKIKTDYDEIAKKLNIHDLHVIPISALLGDNVVNRSENMPWYKGQTLISKLETINIKNDINYDDPRFPVQYVIRPQATEFHDYRGYSGQIVSGFFKEGEEIRVLPSGFSSRIKSLDTFDSSLNVAYAQKSITMTLEDDIDISRGDIIVKPENLPTVGQDLDLMICWFNEKPMNPAIKYIVRHTTNDMKCIIKNINYKMNINTLEKDLGGKKICMNDIANISIKTSKPVVYDKYEKNRSTGSLILIEEGTNETVAAGMIL